MLADDHTIVRQGMAQLLEQQSAIQVAGEAKNGNVAVKMANELNLNNVILDIIVARSNRRLKR